MAQRGEGIESSGGENWGARPAVARDFREDRKLIYRKREKVVEAGRGLHFKKTGSGGIC